MRFAQRIDNLPPYLFAKVDEVFAEAEKDGVDIISFGIGDPDQPTPEHIVNEAIQSLKNPETHSYTSYIGLEKYRRAIVDFYQRRFGVELDPDSEVLALTGSKEGIAHLPIGILNPGAIALIPDPAYPVYNTGTILCDGKPYRIPLREENGFLPDLEGIDLKIAKQARLLFLNYPNNPTGAVASKDFFEKVINFAKVNDIIVAHDMAYAQLGLDGYQPPSILEIPGAKEIAVEFYSLSKTYNMSGWRLGALVGNSQVVDSLKRVKTNMDSGVFEVVQYAGIKAIYDSQKVVKELANLYQERRDLAIKSLRELGWDLEPNQATFYLWIPVPTGYKSQQFSEQVFTRTGVYFTPGIAYGDCGDDYVRLSLTLSQKRMKEAFKRLKENGVYYKYE